MAETTAHMRGGCARGKPNGLIGLNQFSACEADTAFFRGKALFPRQERTVVAEGFIEKRLNQRGSAVGAANSTPVFQTRQIARDTCRRRAGHSEDLFRCCSSIAQEEFNDLLGTVINGVRHIWTDSTVRS